MVAKAGGKSSGLDPWRPGAVVQEVFSHVVLAAIAIAGGLGYLGLLIMLLAEMLFVNLLSVVLYPKRGLRRHLTDLLKFFGLSAFLSVFVVASYSFTVESPSEALVAFASRLLLDWGMLLWIIGYSAVHLTALLVYARTRPDPRLEWTRLALAQGAVTFVSIFILIFAIVLIGAPLAHVLRWLVPTVDSEVIPVALAAGVRLGFALLITRMPESELARIAGNPYID